MKKPIAVALLVIGNVAITHLLVIFVLGAIGNSVFVILPLVCHLYLASKLQRVYNKKGWLKPKKFWLVASLPPIGTSAAAFVGVLIADQMGAFIGGWAGLALLALCVVMWIYSCAFLFALGVITAVRSRFDSADILPRGNFPRAIPEMNKPLGAFLLATGNALIIFLFYTLNAATTLSTLGEIYVSLMLLFVQIDVSLSLWRRFHSRGWRSPVRFWLCIGVSVLLVSAGEVVATVFLGLGRYSFEYIDDVLIRLRYQLRYLAWGGLGYSILLAAGTALVLAISCRRSSSAERDEGKL